jgi:hypothetical protein
MTLESLPFCLMHTLTLIDFHVPRAREAKAQTNYGRRNHGGRFPQLQRSRA